MKIIIGQEAICPDGLGRVIAYKDAFPEQWVQVSTYVNDRQCKWAPHNVQLITLTSLRPVAQCYMNEAGQISLKAMDGDCFDMSKHTGKTFYVQEVHNGLL